MDNTVSITAVGDVLLHGRVYGGLGKKSGYTFDEQLKNVKNLIGNSDINIANLETVIGGNELGLSGFPRFNAPIEIASSLKKLGFDIVNLANNHIMDKGEEGIIRTINNLNNVGMEYVGAYKSEEDNLRLRTYTINDLKICVIGYTHVLNGHRLPQGKEYLVNALKDQSLVKMRRIIERIKHKGNVDVVIANVHFGSEYRLFPNSKQDEIVHAFAEGGADIILGHHPHVLQPPRWIENSQGDKSFVAYSLGNFFSGQNGIHRQVGAVLSINVTKPYKDYKNIIVSNPKYELTYVNRTKRLKYDMYLFREWIDKNPYLVIGKKKVNAMNVYNEIKRRMSTNIEDLEII